MPGNRVGEIVGLSVGAKVGIGVGEGVGLGVFGAGVVASVGGGVGPGIGAGVWGISRGRVSTGAGVGIRVSSIVASGVADVVPPMVGLAVADDEDRWAKEPWVQKHRKQSKADSIGNCMLTYTQSKQAVTVVVPVDSTLTLQNVGLSSWLLGSDLDVRHWRSKPICDSYTLLPLINFFDVEVEF